MSIEIMPFVGALERTLRSMASIEIAGTAMEDVAADEADALRADVTAIIGIVSPENERRANLLLGASAEAACKIAARINGQTTDIMDSLLLDTFGEILNMVVGAAQRDSSARFDFSLPIAIRGNGHSIDPSRETRMRVCRAPSPEGELLLALVNIESTKA